MLDEEWIASHLMFLGRRCGVAGQGGAGQGDHASYAGGVGWLGRETTPRPRRYVHIKHMRCQGFQETLMSPHWSSCLNFLIPTMFVAAICLLLQAQEQRALSTVNKEDTNNTAEESKRGHTSCIMLGDNMPSHSSPAIHILYPPSTCIANAESYTRRTQILIS